MNMVKCENLKKNFYGVYGKTVALNGVSLEIEKKEVFGLVGESGCGKTTLGKIILGMIKPDYGNIAIDTKSIQVVFQDPYNSLDPKMKIFDILAEGLVIKKSDDINKKVRSAIELIRLPESALDKYPHQFSGGERQRIAIGRALLTEPEFIVYDEPVSSLDVTIQLQILNLLKDIKNKFGITCLFISHDLKVIKFICDKVAVMLEGKIVEHGPVKDIYNSPKHPYTKTLLKAAYYNSYNAT